METADSIVADGFQAAGYKYIIIDDCWLAKERDEDGKLQPDPDRFPSGMPALGRYLHDRCAMMLVKSVEEAKHASLLPRSPSEHYQCAEWSA